MQKYSKFCRIGQLPLARKLLTNIFVSTNFQVLYFYKIMRKIFWACHLIFKNVHSRRRPPGEAIKMPPSSKIKIQLNGGGGLMVTNAEICKSRWKTSAQCKMRATRGEFVFGRRKNNRLISLPGECLHWGLSGPHRDHFSLDAAPPKCCPALLK